MRVVFAILFIATKAIKVSTSSTYDGEVARSSCVSHISASVALLDRQLRMHDITALQSSHPCVVRAADFAQLMRQSDFSDASSMLLAGRVRML